ncbi:hypothetical protein Nepgr_031350 [Nepenthes gracilis]|uniref:Uncharacterized protein n=1 Tax=Nepenthes gracilis TaxID=150966 RepID=A0AAD3TIN2_NEPGR|nr:hypothetical protein Nepgr_031350 [Nepenthes gracilis]
MVLAAIIGFFEASARARWSFKFLLQYGQPHGKSEAIAFLLRRCTMPLGDSLGCGLDLGDLDMLTWIILVTWLLV